MRPGPGLGPLARLALPLLVLGAASACGSDPQTGDGGPPDAGSSNDAGTRVDSGASVDAATDIDAAMDGGAHTGADAAADSGSDASSPDAATPDAGSPYPRIATGLDYPQGLAVRDGQLYWVEFGHRVGLVYTAGRLARCALPDCAGGPETLAADLFEPLTVAVDATHAYVGGSPNEPAPLVRCARGGCGDAEVLAGDLCHPTEVVLDGSDVLWTLFCNPGAIQGCDSSACTPQDLAAGFRFPGSLRLVEGDLFWVGHFNDSAVIMTCPRTGCVDTPTWLFSTTELGGGPRELALAGSTMYWTAGGADDGVWSCPLSDCQAGAQRVVPETNPAGLLASGGYLYWTDFGIGSPSALRRCSLADCAGTVEDVATGLGSNVEHFAVTDTHAYVSQPGREPYTGSIAIVPLP